MIIHDVFSLSILTYLLFIQIRKPVLDSHMEYKGVEIWFTSSLVQAHKTSIHVYLKMTTAISVCVCVCVCV